MTSCQISLAAMRLFKSYFAYCFSFVFPKQEIWNEGPVKKKKKYKCSRPLTRAGKPFTFFSETGNRAWKASGTQGNMRVK